MSAEQCGPVLWLRPDDDAGPVRNFLRSHYILRDGEPVPAPDLLSWARWMESGDRVVAKTKVGESEVSTVFLGLDHSFGGGPPVLWESMVFGGELDQEQIRYCSRAEAEAGHAALVARVHAAEMGSDELALAAIRLTAALARQAALDESDRRARWWWFFRYMNRLRAAELAESLGYHGASAELRGMPR